MRKRSGIRTERKRNEEDNKTDCGGEVGQINRGEVGERKKKDAQELFLASPCPLSKLLHA